MIEMFVHALFSYLAISFSYYEITAMIFAMGFTIIFVDNFR